MKIIISFVFGGLLASLMFVCYTVHASNEPKIVCDNGYLSGVVVYTEKGERLCIGPRYEKKTNTMECVY